MKTRIATLVENIRASFWFIPVVMTLGAAVLAYVAIRLDMILGADWLRSFGWLFINNPDGARAALSIIAGSAITVAGTVFSLTMVALTLASSQFGPRLIRSFTRDRNTQYALGTFVATYLYCLLVLAEIRSSDEYTLVPNLAVLVGIVLAVAGIFVLIFFIHHVSVIIQAQHLIAVISDDLQETIRRLYRPALAPDSDEARQLKQAAEMHAEIAEDGGVVPAGASGYLQGVDEDALLELAHRRDLVLDLVPRPGDFVLAQGALARVIPAEAADEDLAREINGAIVLGTQRTPHQDLEAYIYQLVEIAARALSPSLNDPFTAMTCVDRLGAAICLLDEMQPPSPFRFDGDGRLRLVINIFTFAGAVDAAFDMIRQYSRTQAAVTIRMLETLAQIAAQTERADRRAVLRHHADMLRRGAQEALPEPHDLGVVEERHRRVMRAIGEQDHT
ncbi:DUF2254 domain-containing protein [Chloroflexales bacterium ZM16-3]|nr:DUF2254 domain-containing protein [Chloroflexales bacterium ZM16-3]